MSDRRVAREIAVQTLYEISFGEERYPGALAANLERRSASAAVQAYADRLLRAVEDNRAAIDARITAALDNWTFERVALVDRCVLQVGCAEILCFEDVPIAVAISEAIAVAKKFSTEESGGFVNGVLDRIARAVAPPGA